MREDKVKVIIDCDTGIDDMISFALSLASDKLDVIGVTTVAGNQSVDKTTFNTLNALEIMGRTEIPLAQGESHPLERPLEDAGYIHGETGLGTYCFEQPTEKKPVEEKASDFIYKKLMESDEKVAIMALAPLTNIAKLLMEHEDCKGKIDKIVFMGGSIRTGNPTPVSTFNVLADPEAARLVMQSGVPFYMCPLDTTKELYFTDEDIEEIGEIKNPVAQMNYQLCSFYNATVNESNNAKARFKGLCVHDLCTAAYLTNPECFTGVKYYADVETQGELTTGMTVIDYENIMQKTEEERNIVYLDSVNRERIMEEYFRALRSYTK